MIGYAESFCTICKVVRAALPLAYSGLQRGCCPCESLALNSRLCASAARAFKLPLELEAAYSTYPHFCNRKGVTRAALMQWIPASGSAGHANLWFHPDTGHPWCYCHVRSLGMFQHLFI